MHALEKEMATHPSILAWRIPGTEEPGGCRLWGHTELATTEVTQQQQQQLYIKPQAVVTAPLSRLLCIPGRSQRIFPDSI